MHWTIPVPKGLRRAWPSACVICRRWRGRLCDECQTLWAGPRPRCARCGLALSTAQTACGSCLHQPPAFDACQVLADYQFPWNRLIADMKFGGQPDVARPLADALASRLAAAGQLAGVELLIPIPMGPARLRERGYNQAWELARHLARQCRIEAASDCLVRWRETPPQTGLGRAERERNLRDALAVQPHWAQRLAGRHIALVDDVLTTGVTAASAALALRQCGVRRIDVWVVARTAAPSD